MMRHVCQYSGLLAFVAVALVSSVSMAGDWKHAPKSEDYAVHKIYKGKPAPVRLDTKKARRFRTVLREGAKDGPNFAGQYTMVAWGCGLDSFEMAVIDAITGQVWFPPFGCMTLAAGFGIPLPPDKYVPNPAFRLDSRLFVIIGVEVSSDAKPGDRSIQFYVFNKGKFRLVYSIPAPE